MKNGTMRNVIASRSASGVVSNRSFIISTLDCGHEIKTALPRRGGTAYNRARERAMNAKKRRCPYGCSNESPAVAATVALP